jgi:hypothetical protein
MAGIAGIDDELQADRPSPQATTMKTRIAIIRMLHGRNAASLDYEVP